MQSPSFCPTLPFISLPLSHVPDGPSAVSSSARGPAPAGLGRAIQTTQEAGKGRCPRSSAAYLYHRRSCDGSNPCLLEHTSSVSARRAATADLKREFTAASASQGSALDLPPADLSSVACLRLIAWGHAGKPPLPSETAAFGSLPMSSTAVVLKRAVRSSGGTVSVAPSADVYCSAHGDAAAETVIDKAPSKAGCVLLCADQSVAGTIMFRSGCGSAAERLRRDTTINSKSLYRLTAARGVCEV